MPTFYLALAAALMIGIALGAAAVVVYNDRRLMRQDRQRIAAVEKQMDDLLKPGSKHDLKWCVRHDAGEAALFDLVKLRDELQVAQTWLDYSIKRAQHVAQGGSPDDPPTKWAQPDTTQERKEP